MSCSYCGTRKGEGEHRCRRCGRRSDDSLTAESAVPRTDGALAAQIAPSRSVAAIPPAPRLQLQGTTGPPRRVQAKSTTHLVQGSLFPDTPKIIPIASYAPGLAEPPRA